MAVVGGQEYQFYRKYLFQIMQLYKNRADVRAFLEILLSLFTVAIFGLFAIKPTVVTIGGLITQIQSQQAISTQLDEKIQALAVAQQIYEERRETIELLATATPIDPAIEDYIKQAETVAIENSVAVEVVSIRDIPLVGEGKTVVESTSAELEEETKQTFPANAKEVEITLGVSGDYQNLLSYLKSVQSLRRPNLMDSVSFDSLATSDDEVIILTIKGRLAYLPDNQNSSQ